jgi:hypothetical protein
VLHRHSGASLLSEYLGSVAPWSPPGQVVAAQTSEAGQRLYRQIAAELFQMGYRSSKQLPLSPSSMKAMIEAAGAQGPASSARGLEPTREQQDEAGAGDHAGYPNPHHNHKLLAACRLPDHQRYARHAGSRFNRVQHSRPSRHNVPHPAMIIRFDLGPARPIVT